MLITVEKLNEWAASDDIVGWFMKHFPSGSAEYQYVLDALSEEDEVFWANYLMDCAGADDSVICCFNTPYSGKVLYRSARKWAVLI